LSYEYQNKPQALEVKGVGNKTSGADQLAPWASESFADLEPIGEKGTGWLSYAVFGASAVFLRSQDRRDTGPPASEATYTPS
jgi:hypothetical protein